MKFAMKLRKCRLLIREFSLIVIVNHNLQGFKQCLRVNLVPLSSLLYGRIECFYGPTKGSVGISNSLKALDDLGYLARISPIFVFKSRSTICTKPPLYLACSFSVEASLTVAYAKFAESVTSCTLLI